VSFTFTVDEDSSDKAAQEALKDLRRMAKLGRMAQAALDSLRAEGHYDGLAPMISRPMDDWNAKGRKKAEVRIRRLPRRLGVSRADLAPFAGLSLRLGKLKDTSYSGNPCRELELWLDGPMARQTAPGLAEYEIVQSSWRVGDVRVNKGHLSWLKEATYGTGAAFRIYQETKYDGAKKTIEEFAKSVSKKLCTVGQEGMIPAAKTLDLQATAWEWLVADGVSERLLAEVHPAVTVAQVMES
jgi:hypothetical protein